MAWTKAKTAIVVVGAGILLVTGTTAVVVVHHRVGEKIQHKAEITSRMQAIKLSVFQAVLQYARDHQDQIPASLSDLKRYLPQDLPSGLDDDHWEILASGKMTPLLARSDVVLLQEKNIPAGRPKIVGYTDGHISYQR